MRPNVMVTHILLLLLLHTALQSGENAYYNTAGCSWLISNQRHSHCSGLQDYQIII